MTLALPENLKLRFPGKSVFPSVQVDYLISSSPTSNASSPILGKLMIFFYLPENEKHSFSVALPLIIFISISADSDYPCAGWTVNPSPMTLSSSKTLPLQLSLFWPASILPSLWIIPIRLVVKILPATAGDERHVGLIPGSGRSPGGGNGNPLQHSCLENPHGQRSLAGYSPWSQRVRLDRATEHTCPQLLEESRLSQEKGLSNE